MRIGNYIFYPAFFVIFILFPLLVILITLLIISKRRKKQIVITNYIKDTHRHVANKYLKNNMRLREDEYFKKLMFYLNENKEFEPEATLEYGDDFVAVISRELFKEFLKVYKKRATEAANILLLIDSLNGIIEYRDGHIIWIDDDVEKETYFSEMDEQEARMENIIINCLDKKIDLFDPVTNLLPEGAVKFPPLKNYTMKELKRCGTRIIKSKDMFNLEDDVREVVINIMIDEVGMFLDLFEDGLLNSLRLYKLRILGALLRNENYEQIIENLK